MDSSGKTTYKIEIEKWCKEAKLVYSADCAVLEMEKKHAKDEVVYAADGTRKGKKVENKRRHGYDND